ncbi:MAG: hypothetical protein ABIZ91_19550 [Gemmatimonadaceae bacterium]
MSPLKFAATLSLCVLSACRGAVDPWGPSLESAKRNADNVFAAFAYRYHNVQRDGKFTVARQKMGRYALIPSKIFNDTSVWTTMAGDTARSFVMEGALSDSRYLFRARGSAGLPDRLGEQRHSLQLRALGDDNFEWITHVDQGIGPVRAEQVGRALGALFTSFESMRDQNIPRHARTVFPHTARHLGQLFAIDSLRTVAVGDGSTSFFMRITLSPDTLRVRYPAFAAYLDKYVMPSTLRMQLTDRSGATYFDLDKHDDHFTVRLRAKSGELVALSGPARPMPDSLRIRLDASAKFMLFRVGYSNLVGDFIFERSAHERAWFMRFQKEPDWRLPLAADRLIKSPLRRPFEGRGTELRLGVRDDLGNQAMSQRQVRTAVRESAIMRFLGGLGASAFGDFSGNSEVEENRFISETFGALRQDFAAIAR